MSILREDVETVAKSFDEHVLIGVTSVECFIEYLERVEVVKAETNTEDDDFLVKRGHFEGLVDARRRIADANSIVVLAVYSYDEECVGVDVEKDLRGRIARTYAYYPVVRILADKVVNFLVEKGFDAASGQDVPLKVAATRAGMGFQGKHTILITKPYGSYVALRAVITNARIEADEPYGEPECGRCIACLKACPTGAIYQPFKVNPRKCINVLTRIPRYIPPEIRVKMDARLLGCDICQEVCPKNRFLKPRKRSEHAGFQPEYHMSHEHLAGVKENFPKLIPLLNRGKSPMIRRNAAIILGNLGDPRALPALKEQLKKEDEFVRPYIQYAIQQIERPS
ncbi:MAG: epoxyqueuosine reductase [Candidatus Bathyarchaeia archaeon]